MRHRDNSHAVSTPMSSDMKIQDVDSVRENIILQFQMSAVIYTNTTQQGENLTYKITQH